MEDVTPGEWFVAGCRVKIERQETHAICRYDDISKKDTNIANVWYDPKSNNGWSDARLIALAPTLARRVIAAEKLVDALSLIADGHSWQRDTATDALAEWEAAQ